MIDVTDRHGYPTAAPFVPEQADLDGLARGARDCRGCDLYERASQTVFGEGSADAEVVLVGEQPGDQEDRRGRPFVGPAGRLLDQALGDAEIARLRPLVVVTLGATAGQALFGSSFRITKSRGQRISWRPDPDEDGTGELAVVPTVHPSSVIRLQGDDRERAYAAFVGDLRTAAALIGGR
jgi:DNA polymerase